MNWTSPALRDVIVLSPMTRFTGPLVTGTRIRSNACVRGFSGALCEGHTRHDDLRIVSEGGARDPGVTWPCTGETDRRRLRGRQAGDEQCEKQRTRRDISSSTSQKKVQSCNPAILQFCNTMSHHPMSAETRTSRPLERFWPYADLPEQPTDEELAALDPDLYEALFGAQPRPFSITLVFPSLEVPDFARAPRARLACLGGISRDRAAARAPRYRARFWSTRRRAAARSVHHCRPVCDDTEVLIDDRPVPYARELWLPLVWLLIPR